MDTSVLNTNMSAKICRLKISPPRCCPSVKHCFLIPINRSRIKHTCARKKPQTHYVRTSSRYVGPSDGWACWRCQLIWAWDGVGGWGRGDLSFLPPLYIQFWRVGHIQHRGFLRGGTASVWEQGWKKGLKKTKINNLSWEHRAGPGAILMRKLQKIRFF